MPILHNAKTVWVADEPWKSPDGKVTIWTIKLEINGERATHSTMSKSLATEGWSGDVEVYTNAKGKDYVRQAPKEDGGYGKPYGAGEISKETGTQERLTKSYGKSSEEQESIARSVALKAAVDYVGTDKDVTMAHTVLKVADQFLAWLQGSSERKPYSGLDIKSSGRSQAQLDTANAQQTHAYDRRQERDEYNDMRSNSDPLPEYPGDEGY